MIAEHRGEIPVVILLLPFLAGLTFGLHYPALNSLLLWYAFITPGLVFIALRVGYNRLNIYKVRWIGGALMMPLLVFAGWLTVSQHQSLNNPDHFSKRPAQYLLVRITNEPAVKNDLIKFTAEVTHTVDQGKIQKANGTLLVTIKDELAKNMFYGEKVLIPATYTSIDAPRNPGEFNYKQYLANKNIFHQAFLYPKQYRVINAAYGNPIIAFALETRQTLVKKLQANMHDTMATAVASTLILGYKADLSNDVLQAYSKTGTIHILSVSGGHVAIIYLLLGWMLGFLEGSKRGKLFKAIIIIVLIWAYALLTGFSPAVNRAALMISMIIVGKTYSRFINSLNILAFSAFALLLYDPFLLTDVGFQLSYLAVAGLIIFQPRVYSWLIFKNNIANYLWKACSVSLSAQAITFPLSAFYFHQFPIYFLLSNVLIIAPIIIVMYAGLFLLALPQTVYLSAGLGYVLEHSILLMNKMLAVVEHLPFAVFDKIWLNRTEHLLLYVIIIAAFYWSYNKKVWIMRCTLCTALLLSISISIKKFQADNQQAVTFLSLRKHTGIVFKNGNRGVVVTDLADTDKIFKYSVQPGLDSSNITDYTVFTPKTDIRLPWLNKQAELIQFADKRLLLLNHYTPVQSIPRQSKINYVYVSGNAFIDPKSYKNELIILDGSNKDSYIDLIKSIPVNCIVLKRNKSLTMLSN